MSATVHTVILAGGFGTRLRPLTDHRPKPLVPVAGVPLVGRQLRWLREAGIRDVTLATSYLADQFTAALADGAAYDMHVTYAFEREPLGTAGALRNALDDKTFGADDCIVVVNGDQLTHHDLGAQLRAHRAHALALATLHCRNVTAARNFGLVALDGAGQVVGFEEKPAAPIGGVVNAGTYVLHPGVLHRIPSGQVCSLEREVFPALAAEGALSAYVQDAYCLDVGTPAAYVQANTDAVQADSGERLIDPTASVHPSAVVNGGSWIGPGAVVEAGAQVAGSVVLAHARVGDHARVVRSVLAPGSRITPGTTIIEDVVADNSTFTG